MKSIIVAALGAAGFTAIMPAAPAQADDAYVCDGGRLVYARPETLEKLKQTDPCIAGYFGLAPVRPANTAPSAATRPAPAPGEPGNDAARGGQPARSPALKPALAPALKPSVAKSRAPEQAAGTDFRNVTIINASPGATPVFRHER